MEVMVAVQSGTLLRALRVQLKIKSFRPAEEKITTKSLRRSEEESSIPEQ
jgi:hypothetical protein